MFGVLGMMGNYEERKVDRFEKGDVFVDTAAITDSEHPYETGIRHPRYNNGELIIVAMYDTKEEAKKDTIIG